MTTIIVGEGEDYEGADALRNLVADYTTLANEGIVTVKIKAEEYTYNGGMILNHSGCDVNNHFVFEVYEGHEHKGNFSANTPKIRTFSNDASIGGVPYSYITKRPYAFSISSKYHKFKNLYFTPSGLTNDNSASSAFHVYDGMYTDIENVLFDGRNSGSSVYDLFIRSGWNISGYPFTNLKVKNSIIYNDGSLHPYYTGSIFTATKANYLPYGRDGEDLIELYNCLFINVAIGIHNAAHKIYNTGVIQTYSSGAASNIWPHETSNIIGSGNYHQGLPADAGPGSNYVKYSSLSSMQFIDTANLKFNLKLNSPLIGTGADVTVSNPKSISNIAWLGNHKSPFDNVILNNAIIQPPEDTSVVHGNWANGLVLNEYSGIATVGAIMQTPELANSHWGNVRSAVNVQYIPLIINSNKLTISCILKGLNAGGGSGILLNNNGTVILLDNDSNKIKLNLTKVGIVYDFTAQFDPIIYCDANDYFVLTVRIDLTQSTNENKVKMYVYQKGQMQSVTLTFTGTAPTNIDLSADYILYSGNNATQGLTSVWDRALSTDEIYNICYDPYIIYRDDVKLFRILDILKSASLWFLRKFIMEKR